MFTGVIGISARMFTLVINISTMVLICFTVIGIRDKYDKA